MNHEHLIASSCLMKHEQGTALPVGVWQSANTVLHYQWLFGNVLTWHRIAGSCTLMQAPRHKGCDFLHTLLWVGLWFIHFQSGEPESAVSSDSWWVGEWVTTSLLCAVCKRASAWVCAWRERGGCACVRVCVCGGDDWRMCLYIHLELNCVTLKTVSGPAPLCHPLYHVYSSRICNNCNDRNYFYYSANGDHNTDDDEVGGDDVSKDSPQTQQM